MNAKPLLCFAPCPPAFAVRAFAARPSFAYRLWLRGEQRRVMRNAWAITALACGVYAGFCFVVVNWPQVVGAAS